jgi:hypothetical protein
MGQVMWPAIDENESAAYGKTMEKTRLKPVFLDLIAPEDIEAVLKAEARPFIRQRATVRLFKQAKEQGGVLSCADAASLMRLSLATVSKYVRAWEKEKQENAAAKGRVIKKKRSRNPIQGGNREVEEEGPDKKISSISDQK